MRYSLSDLENRFAGRPNARWSSIRAELKSLETAAALREEAEIQKIRAAFGQGYREASKAIIQKWEEDEASMKIADAVIADMPRPSYFDRLLAWFK